MLLFLSTNTRPDICYAVSVVCRFANSIISILKNFNLDCYVDANFAGNYKCDPDNSPDSAKSRGGYIIKLSGVPLLWKSQLLSTICLSSCESEYLSLSKACLLMLYIKRTVRHMISALDLPVFMHPTMHSRIFEDNAAALAIAVNQRLTARTRHFLTKWHHFWSHTYPHGEQLNIQKIATDLQDADYFTKGLVRDLFERNRLRVQGW